MTHILIIDDEPGIRRTLASILEDEHYRVFTAEDAVLGIEILEKENISLVFLDVLLPRMGGIEALDTIHKNWPQVEVVMISGHANVDMAVRAVKLGAFDFLEKPLSLDKVLTVCRNALALHKLREENHALKKKVPRDELIGASPEMEKVKALVNQAAISEARILISGENGTGKEVVARTIHRLSPRADKPFVEVNCAAIPETLIESELFGHEKGAFTDASAIRKGRFETASGGTLFLDEIGDMSLAAQTKVLRAIQEQKIERLGGEETINVDVRILAATNKDLERACAEGKFRQDLFFRLNVIPIRLPSLRERKSDIPFLLFHFLEALSPDAVEFEKEALDMLGDYSWPGNVRELKNFAERIAVMYSGGKVGAETAAEFLKKDALSQAPGQAGEQALDETLALKGLLDKDFNTAKEFFEKLYLEFQLFKNHGIISKTAEAIGIYPSNLHAKLKKYKIAIPANKD
ncbi:sigma-54-dependent transcriptional regulator [Leadbettera azotonutricia]|uniref:Nitrogen assimilation regulatory protein NtrX n=1 Tax=Leadbettera azotonutricia (strain ATCC BAA-888 / DSM 13862 / ZAS-9) TaxID=545695 RepID=F5YFW2_LEAAZ|nr:sigma-54 dependent transcriptional regulator [Leadbettera azotonutricia]AEF82519.1 nitrogen assimilation regulatory protein NtrX [Leadbettera azotonutricia ZAS-9]